MNASPARLLIVYNAEAGIVAGIRDSFHKLLDPATYPCSLCALTHGLVRQDPAWTRFLASLDVEVAVYHRADFRADFPGRDIALPAILVSQGDDVVSLVDADELRTISSLDRLIARIQDRLVNHGCALPPRRGRQGRR